jgi:hypothetical protein
MRYQQNLSKGVQSHRIQYAGIARSAKWSVAEMKRLWQLPLHYTVRIVKITVRRPGVAPGGAMRQMPA